MKLFDFTIIGSGFSGSITAMALTQMGYSVCLIEKDRHPRFAIGESSTPIADMILRDLAEEYDLPFLKKISRYGEWQRHYPEITCGLKRGFSYYFHQKGEVFQTDKFHNRELLVAASENDQNSDTNWLRSDVDQFLVNKAVEIGVFYYENTTINNLSRDTVNEKWRISLIQDHTQRDIECKWIIDATGSAGFAIKHLDVQNVTTGFHTRSYAIYSHFDNTMNWSDYLESIGIDRSDYPYNPDFSALHQVIDEGWIWMLRFNNNRLSSGLLIDEETTKMDPDKSAEEVWMNTIGEYPSIAELFKNAKLSQIPNKIMKTGILQRKLNRVFGDGWVVLPHTAGFIDPLHSTGIAFTLSGVETILSLFREEPVRIRSEEFIKYQDKIYKELYIIDLLISMSYRTRFSSKLFMASTMLYFIASIKYEKKRLAGKSPGTFLCAGEQEIINLVNTSHEEIQNLQQKGVSEDQIDNQVEKIRKRIKPFNDVGLMDPKFQNMYRHTSVIL